MERWHRLGLFAALAVAAALRFWANGAESLWLDELFSVRAASRETLSGLLEEVSVDVHPPLFYLLLRGWMSLVGDSEVALRALPALIGVATVGATFLLARRLYEPGVGVAAAWLLAVAPFAVDLDREVRANTLLTLFGVLSTWALLRRTWLVYVVLVGLLGWTHPFGLLVVVGHGLWLAGEAGSGGASGTEVRRWFRAVLGGLLIVAPWVPRMVAQSASFGDHPWYAPPAPDVLAWLMPDLAGGGGPLAVLLVGVVLLYARGDAGPGGRLLPAMLLALVGVAHVISVTAAPILRDRNVLPLLPVLVLCAAAGLYRVPGAGAGLVLVATLFSGLVSVGNVRDVRKQDWRGAARVVQAGWQEGDRVDANFRTLWAYYLPEVWTEPLSPGRVWTVRAHTDLVTTGDPSSGELVEEWWLPGAHVALRDPRVRRVSIGTEMGPPMWDGTLLHFYWNQRVRSAVVPMSGNCSVGLVGTGEEVDGVGAELAVRLLVDDVVTKTWMVELPARRTQWWSMPVRTGDAAIEVEFRNDASGSTSAGAPGDRNAHVDRVLVRCA